MELLGRGAQPTSALTSCADKPPYTLWSLDPQENPYDAAESAARPTQLGHSLQFVLLNPRVKHNPRHSPLASQKQGPPFLNPFQEYFYPSSPSHSLQLQEAVLSSIAP